MANRTASRAAVSGHISEFLGRRSWESPVNPDTERVQTWQAQDKSPACAAAPIQIDDPDGSSQKISVRAEPMTRKGRKQRRKELRAESSQPQDTDSSAS